MKLVKGWQKSYKWASMWGGILTTLLGISALAAQLLPIWRGLLDPDTYAYAMAITGTITVVGRLWDQGLSDE